MRQVSKLTVRRTATPGTMPEKETLVCAFWVVTNFGLSAALQVFGRTFTDHTLEIDWDSQHGWHAPKISPFGNLSLHPAASSLHYGLQVIPALPVVLCVRSARFAYTAEFARWLVL